MRIDYVHFYVEDAQAWRNWFVNYLGFQTVADGDFPSTWPSLRARDTCTEVVKSGEIYFVLSSPLTLDSPVAQFLRYHPPGVADVTFRVADVAGAMMRAEAQGATVLEPLQECRLGQEYIRYGKIAAWGTLVHTLVERHSVQAQHGVVAGESPPMFGAIDHVVLNVAAGDLHKAIAWYENMLDFQPQQKFTIQTPNSALHSQVMVSRLGNVQLPINEPASANSQIQEFLDLNGGPGVQHIALRTTNIVSAISQCRTRGLSLLPVPPTYYHQMQKRPGLPISEAELFAIAQQQILVDWQEHQPQSLLLQIFTQPIFTQPTFFFELIERRAAANGFGEGNFRALFEAMEQEQIKRGSLN